MEQNEYFIDLTKIKETIVERRPNDYIYNYDVIILYLC